ALWRQAAPPRYHGHRSTPYGRRPEVESFRRRDRSSGARSGCPPIAATQTGIGPRRSDITRLCPKALIYAGCITVDYATVGRTPGPQPTPGRLLAGDHIIVRYSPRPRRASAADPGSAPPCRPSREPECPDSVKHPRRVAEIP